jgi:hypothetical protein
MVRVTNLVACFSYQSTETVHPKLCVFRFPSFQRFEFPGFTSRTHLRTKAGVEGIESSSSSLGQMEQLASRLGNVGGLVCVAGLVSIYSCLRASNNYLVTPSPCRACHSEGRVYEAVRVRLHDVRFAVMECNGYQLWLGVLVI